MVVFPKNSYYATELLGIVSACLIATNPTAYEKYEDATNV